MRHVLGMHQAKTQIGFKIHAALLVHDTALGTCRLTRVGGNGKVWRSPDTPDKGRDFKLDIHTLRPVLEKPATMSIALVIAGDEVDQLVMLEQRPLGEWIFATLALLLQGKWPGCLRAVVAQIPVAACIQPEPAEAVRNIWPFRNGLLDDVIHRAILRCF